MTKHFNPAARFWSVGELAARWNVSSKTVRRWIDDKKLHSHRFGRQIRVSDEDADSFVASRRR